MCRGAPNKKREDIKTNNLQGSERTNVTQAHQREKYAARVQIRKQVRENTAFQLKDSGQPLPRVFMKTWQCRRRQTQMTQSLKLKQVLQREFERISSICPTLLRLLSLRCCLISLQTTLPRQHSATSQLLAFEITPMFQSDKLLRFCKVCHKVRDGYQRMRER